jgi:outer membrane protein TolC
MTMKSAATIISVLITAGSATAQVLNIDGCYSLAVKNYPLVKQYELIEKSKEYTLSNASKAYLPQVSLNAIEGYVFGGLPSTGTSGSGNFNFVGLGQVSQPIWDGGATKTQKSIIKASSETEKAHVDVAIHDLRSRVNQLYFGILLVDEHLKQLEVQNAILTNNINRIKQLNDNGLVYKTDVDEIRVEQIKLNQQKKEFNYTRNGYVTMLSLLTGVKLDNQAIFQRPLPDNLSYDPEISRPELYLYKSQRNLVNAQAGMQHVNLMPRLCLLGAGVVFAPGVSLGGGKLSTLGIAGLGASWNVSGLYRNSNEKKLTQQALNKIDVQEETFLFNTKLQMTQTSANIEKQQAILVDDDEMVSLRQTIREGYQLKYDTGVGPLHDFLNAVEKENEARAQKVTHEIQLLMIKYEYKTISGN